MEGVFDAGQHELYGNGGRKRNGGREAAVSVSKEA